MSGLPASSDQAMTTACSPEIPALPESTPSGLTQLVDRDHVSASAANLSSARRSAALRPSCSRACAALSEICVCRLGEGGSEGIRTPHGYIVWPVAVGRPGRPLGRGGTTGRFALRVRVGRPGSSGVRDDRRVVSTVWLQRCHTLLVSGRPAALILPDGPRRVVPASSSSRALAAHLLSRLDTFREVGDAHRPCSLRCPMMRSASGRRVGLSRIVRASVPREDVVDGAAVLSSRWAAVTVMTPLSPSRLKLSLDSQTVSRSLVPRMCRPGGRCGARRRGAVSSRRIRGTQIGAMSVGRSLRAALHAASGSKMKRVA